MTAYLAMRVCATVLWCHTCNLLLCGLLGGANLAMRIFGAGLWCQVRNLLCGLFEGGAYLAMYVCATVLRCHTRNILLCGIFGGPIWPYVSVVPDFGAMHTTSFSVGYLGGRFGHACLCHQTLVPHMQTLSLFAM